MKNIFLTVLSLLGLALTIVSCEEEPAVNTPKHIVVSEQEVEVSEEGDLLMLGYQIVEPISGEELKVSCADDWAHSFKVLPGMIEFVVERNETGEARQTTITLAYADEKCDVTLNQGVWIAPFSVSIDAVDATSVTFSVKARDEESTWVGQVVGREWYDKYTQEQIYAEDLNYYSTMASEAGLSLADYISSILSKGSHSGLKIKGLDIESEYVIYIYGMDQYGDYTTEIFTAYFTTTEPYQGNDVTFDINIVCQNAIADITVTPSHDGVAYFNNLITREDYELYGGNVNDAADALIAKIVDDYAYWDYTLAETFAYNSDYLETKYSVEVLSGVEYIVMAFKWNEQCERMSEVSYEWFTADEIKMSENKIEVEVSNVTQTTFDIVTDTTNEDQYVVYAEYSSNLVGLETGEEIFAYLLQNYGTWGLEYYICNGDISGTFKYLDTNTEYDILVFGYQAGVMTTEMQSVNITTLEAGAIDDCVYDITISDIDDREANVTIRPSDTSVWYYWNVFDASATADDVKALVAEALEVGYNGSYSDFSYYEVDQGNYVSGLGNLIPNHDYKIGIVPMNPEKYEFTGEVVFGGEFTTEEAHVADINIVATFDEYYDGDVLADYSADYFEEFRGYAMAPIEVTVDGGYASYFYTVFKYVEGLENDADYGDDMLIETLINKGVSYSPMQFRLPWDTELFIAAVAFDYDGNASKVYREKFICTHEGASPNAEDYAYEYIYGTAPAAAQTLSVVYAENSVAEPVAVESVPERLLTKRTEGICFER